MIWKFKPDWAAGWKVTRSYLTDVLTSDDGSEQRRAVNVWPRKSYEFSLQETGADLRSLNRQLRYGQHLTIVIPDEVRTVNITGQFTSSVTVATKPSWALPGNKVVLGDGDNREVATIASTPGTTINFTSNLTYSHGVGETMYFGIEGALADELPSTRPTNDIATVQVTFNQRPSSEVYSEPPVAPTTFNSRELFIMEPNWAQEMDLSYQRPTQVVDFDFGVISRFAPQRHHSALTQATWLGLSRDDVKLLEDVFDRAKGQRGEFYMPTGENDIPLAFNVSSGGTGLVTLGTELAESYVDERVYRAVYVLLKDGRYFCRQVDNVYTNSGNTVVGLDTPVPYAFTVAEVEMVCWLPVCRFASDSMTTEWLTDEVAQTRLSIRTLPAMAPE